MSSKLFMRTISQNLNENQTGISLWTLEDVKAAQEKQKAAQAAAVPTVKPKATGPGGDDAMEIDDEDDEFGDGGITDAMLNAINLNGEPGTEGQVTQ